MSRAYPWPEPAAAAEAQRQIEALEAQRLALAAQIEAIITSLESAGAAIGSAEREAGLAWLAQRPAVRLVQPARRWGPDRPLKGWLTRRSRASVWVWDGTREYRYPATSLTDRGAPIGENGGPWLEYSSLPPELAP